jgi:hypothetical protein
VIVPMRKHCVWLRAAQLSLFLLFIFSSAQAQLGSVEPVQRVSLTDEQLTKIQDGVRRELKTSDPIQHGQTIGGKDSKGVVHVCGWIGTQSGLVPFSGRFSDTGFIVIRAATDQRNADATMVTCKARGPGL